MFFKSTLKKLSVEYDERSVRVVQSCAGNVVSIERCHAFNWPPGVSLQTDPKSAGAWLKDQLALVDFDTAGQPATAIVQRESIILKSIVLPRVSADETAALIQYQAATHFSVDASELSIGHIVAPPAENETRCLLMALPLNIERQWRTFCESAGLQLTAIVPRSVAVTVSLREFAATPFDPGDGRILIVRDGSTDGLTVEICFQQAQRLIQNISVMLPDDFADWASAISGSIRRVLSGTITSQPVDVSCVTLVGDFPDGFDRQLSVQIEIPVDRRNLIAQVHLADESIRRSHGMSVGLLANSLAEIAPVNFLEQHHKQTAVNRNARRVKYALLAAAGIVMGLFAQNQFAESRHRKAMSKLVSQRRYVEQQIAAGQSEVALANHIEHWQDVRFSKRLTEFFDVLPADDQSQLTSLELALLREPGDLAIKAAGLMAQQETILALNDRLLAQADYHMLPHGLQPVQSHGPMKYRFELDIAIKNQIAEPSVKARSARPRVTRSKSVTLDSLQTRLDETNAELADVQQTRLRLKEIAGRTLAKTPSVASQQYHKVLLCLAQQYELADPVFAPHRPQLVNDRLRTIPFSFQVAATLQQLQTFVAHFEQLDVLHRITRIAIEPSRIAGDSRLRCQMQFETACVEVDGVKEHLNPTALFVASFDERLVSISNRNPFGRAVPEANQTFVAEIEQPKPATVLVLVGVIEDGENSEAWFLDKSTGQNHIARLNGDFNHDALAGRLIAVDQDSVTLQVANTQVHLTIGENARGPERIATRP